MSKTNIVIMIRAFILVVAQGVAMCFIGFDGLEEWWNSSIGDLSVRHLFLLCVVMVWFFSRPSAD